MDYLFPLLVALGLGFLFIFQGNFNKSKKVNPITEPTVGAPPTRNPNSEEFYHLLDQKTPLDIYKDEMFHDRLKALLDFQDDLGDFNPEDNETLDRFENIKQNTACLFARRSKLWGGPWDDSLTAQENFRNCMPLLGRFVKTVKLKKCLDGLVIEVRGEQYCNSVENVSSTFREFCQIVSDADPCRSRFMDISPDKNRYWSFLFGDEAFFITTFAPCYPVTHPRHSYGVNSLFILMQPEVSFAVHDIPVDSPVGSIRWKIQEAFKAIGQPYDHDQPKHTTVAWWFVRPLENFLNGHGTETQEKGKKHVDGGNSTMPWWRRPALPQVGAAQNGQAM